MNLRKIRKALGLAFFFIYNRVVQIVPLKNQVSFFTEAHDELTGNLKAMLDYMEKKGDHRRKLVFAKGDRRNSNSFLEFLQICKALSLSKYIFLDDFYGLMSTMKVRKNQEVVQLWHGCGAYKKFGFSRLETDLKGGRVHSGYKRYTKVTVTSEDIRDCYAEAFGVPIGNVSAKGSPDTDVLFDENYKIGSRTLLEFMYPCTKDKKLVLFAPTYRGNRVEKAGYDFEKIRPEQIMKDLGEEYVMLVRWHPAIYANIKSGRENFQLAEGMIDVSSCSDVNTLLGAADILVTDYSSIIFDWYIMEKPIIFYLYDKDVYEGDRGLYFPIENYIYGELATDYNELIHALKASKNNESKRNRFGNQFMAACKGKSCENVYKWIFENN